MSSMTKLGIIAYAKEGVDKNWNMESQAWFEGFATAMNEIGSITDDEYNEVLNALVDITAEVNNEGGDLDG